MNGKKIVESYIEKKILPDISLDRVLDQLTEEFSEKIALVDANRRITYTGLHREAIRTAKIFAAEGLKKGDNVMIWMNNRIEFFTVSFALFYLGVKPILMLPNHRRKELETIGRFASAVAVVTYGSELGADYSKIAADLKNRCHSIKKIFSYQDDQADVNLSSYPNSMFDQIVLGAGPAASDIALFLLSGGTTGIPKLIPKRHAAYLYNASCSADRCEVTGDSVYLAALSIAHDYPLCCPGVFGTMLCGGKSVLAKTASFDEVREWVAKERVTFTSIAPIIAQMWVECMEWSNDLDISSLEYFLIGAAKLSEDAAGKIEAAFNVKIIQGYGLGEGITCFTTKEDPSDISWNCQGRPISGYDEVKIVAEDGSEAGPLETGELLQKGPYTFAGYYNADEINRRVFTDDGYFCTGDKALLTKEGNIKIVGRVKEQINRAGENIIPSEIEQYLSAHEQIREAAVIGLPDATLGEKICAVLIKNSTGLSKEEICKYLTAEGLSNFKLPDCIVYVDRLPYINVGKVDKKSLRKQIIDG